MKTHEKQENQEIGELIREITEKGFTGIVTDVCDDMETRFVAVTVTDYRRLELGEPEAELTFETSSLVEALRLIVDSIRTQRGEPTLAEEVEAMILQEEAHSKTLIHCAPGARCTCGFPFLEIEKTPKFTLLVELATGEVLFKEEPKPFTVDPGEIARCPNCGHWYQFGA